jgi:hypothetical protein
MSFVDSNSLVANSAAQFNPPFTQSHNIEAFIVLNFVDT